MVALESVTATGASGRRYSFEAHPWGERFGKVGAVYLVTHRSPRARGGGHHTPLYIGQTGDMSQRFDDHQKIDCFRRGRANCICIYPVRDEKIRLRIEADLRTKYRPPCND